MVIHSRLNRLEQRVKPLQEEFEQKEKERRDKEKSFELINEIMEECHPSHGWCKYTKEERLRIYNKPSPRGTVIHTDSLLPRHIPSKKKEDILYCEANRLVGDVIKTEILRRRTNKGQNN